MNSDGTDTNEMAIIRKRVRSGEIALSGTSAGTAC
jgi:cyanophycinase-like exopeptidase